MPDVVNAITVNIAAALIKTFEDCRLKAYEDTGGVWTIGFGHTKDVKAGDTCTQEQADIWFEQDALPLFNAVIGLKPVLGAALVSFGYNCGFHTMMSVIDGGTWASILKYIHDRHGNILSGLINRRALEYALASSGC